MHAVTRFQCDPFILQQQMVKIRKKQQISFVKSIARIVLIAILVLVLKSEIERKKFSSWKLEKRLCKIILVVLFLLSSLFQLENCKGLPRYIKNGHQMQGYIGLLTSFLRFRQNWLKTHHIKMFLWIVTPRQELYMCPLKLFPVTSHLTIISTHNQ